MALLNSRTTFLRAGTLFRSGLYRLGGVGDEALRLLSHYAADRFLRRALFAMLSVFSLVVLAHTIHYFAPKLGLDTTPTLVRMMSLNEEWGFGEMYAHLLCVIFVVAMLRTYGRTRQRIYIALATAFAVVLIDDSLQLHEKVGRYLTGAVDLPSIPDLAAVDIGQFAAFGLFGVLILAILYFGFRDSEGQDARVGAILSLVLCGLGVFAVVIDPLHGALVHKFQGAHLILTLAEDGGEILVLVLACAIALAVDRRSAAVAVPISDTRRSAGVRGCGP